MLQTQQRQTRHHHAWPRPLHTRHAISAITVDPARCHVSHLRHPQYDREINKQPSHTNSTIIIEDCTFARTTFRATSDLGALSEGTSLTQAARGFAWERRQHVAMHAASPQAHSLHSSSDTLTPAPSTAKAPARHQAAHLRQEQQRVLVGEGDLVALAPPPPLGVDGPPGWVSVSAPGAWLPCTTTQLKQALHVRRAR